MSFPVKKQHKTPIYTQIIQNKLPRILTADASKYADYTHLHSYAKLA